MLVCLYEEIHTLAVGSVLGGGSNGILDYHNT